MRAQVIRIQILFDLHLTRSLLIGVSKPETFELRECNASLNTLTIKMSATKKFKRQTTLFALFGRPKPSLPEPDNKNKSDPKEIKKGKTKHKQNKKRAKKHLPGQKTLVTMFTPVKFACAHSQHCFKHSNARNIRECKHARLKPRPQKNHSREKLVAANDCIETKRWRPNPEQS